MVRVVLTLVVFFAFAAGVIMLQIFLSKKENKWLGLILPFISLAISIVAVLGIGSFTTTGTVQIIRDSTGAIIQQEEVETINRTQETASLGLTVVSTFLLFNIPTIVLLAIYFGCREKQRQRKSLEKMQAQDLE
jgi:uncharacterized membrane protein YoaK (UPF0700 family)